MQKAQGPYIYTETRICIAAAAVVLKLIRMSLCLIFTPVRVANVQQSEINFATLAA